MAAEVLQLRDVLCLVSKCRPSLLRLISEKDVTYFDVSAKPLWESNAIGGRSNCQEGS